MHQPTNLLETWQPSCDSLISTKILFQHFIEGLFPKHDFFSFFIYVYLLVEPYENSNKDEMKCSCTVERNHKRSGYIF